MGFKLLFLMFDSTPPGCPRIYGVSFSLNLTPCPFISRNFNPGSLLQEDVRAVTIFVTPLLRCVVKMESDDI